ncbi:hypothetical protein EJ02DRAFT_489872 [Clathrospora elynae]|uniref:Uncharacterized protein n=1 Tax=Clathrospora elynae TaxID=706981 RepID=A0A6A5S3I0_9PLEO|nr:hypothetical protein EJ02DRAFT_489872 [Clathrospora elynae]
MAGCRNPARGLSAAAPNTQRKMDSPAQLQREQHRNDAQLLMEQHQRDDGNKEASELSEEVQDSVKASGSGNCVNPEGHASSHRVPRGDPPASQRDNSEGSHQTKASVPQNAFAGSMANRTRTASGGVTPDACHDNGVPRLNNCQDPPRTLPGGVLSMQPPMAGSDAFLQKLMSDLFAAEDKGASEERLASLKNRIDLASNALGPRPTRTVTEGSCINTDAGYLILLVDSTTRTLWAVGTIQFNTHRELLQQRLRDGPTPTPTWAWLKSKERKLVQDPVLTKFDNFVKFFNFEWHSNNTVSSFLLQLSRKENLLPHSFFKMEDGTDNDEFKIAFVWSKIPDTYRRKIQRSGSLETVTLWSGFERILRNAKTATCPINNTALSLGNAGDGSAQGKRQASQLLPSNKWVGGKKQDRKPSNQSYQQRTSLGHNNNMQGGCPQGGYEGNQRNDVNPQGARPQSGQQGSRRSYNACPIDNRSQSGNNVNNRPLHWKNCENQGGHGNPQESGKAKP